MCSVSWQWEQKAGGKADLFIAFNRDERKARMAGLPPRVLKEGDHEILCPVDPEKGGTWLAANNSGLVAGILNFYGGESAQLDKATSRGNLVREVAAASGVGEVQKILDFAVSEKRYNPFSILVWQRDRVGKWDWSGNQISYDPNPAPLVTSSSWDTGRVERWRRRFYEEKVVEGGWTLEQFHRHVVPGDEGSSVCMMRPETQTVSLTTCRVTDSEIAMAYFPRDERGEFGEGVPAKLLL